MISPQERRPRIVIADDHPSVLVAFARMLQPVCEVLATVTSGQHAVATVTTLHPDVLVVDLMMPDLDGLEVCRRVTRMCPATAVVIVTAYDDAHVEKIALQEGVAAFVPKCAATATLAETIVRIFLERQPTWREPADEARS